MNKATLATRPAELPLAELPPTESAFEQYLRDPNVSADKLERFMALKERMDAKAAESEFNAAMSRAQAEIRPVVADAENPQTRSKYASYEALDRVLRPIYTTHGFGLSFDTAEGAQLEWVRVQCYVTHASGHARTYHADIPADGKGAKGGDVMTKTHAVGSAMSYGMRYLLKMIFNVAVWEGDDDGNAAGGKPTPEAPAGFDGWLTDLTAVADNGQAPLREAWNKSKKEYRDYLTAHMPDVWAGVKTKALKVQAA